MNMDELVVQDEYVYKEETLLTVLKTSRFFSGDGFVVYDCMGQLVFRFDSYGPSTRDKEELVLMNTHGRSLLTLRKKVCTHHHNHSLLFLVFGFSSFLSKFFNYLVFGYGKELV
jgi:hypothetical protein